MPRGSNVTLCSFCGKSHAEVRKLIAGPGVYICDNCIGVCKTILDKEATQDSDTVPPLMVPRPADIAAIPDGKAMQGASSRIESACSSASHVGLS